MTAIKDIGRIVRRTGETMSEFGGAFETGATQDLRFELPRAGGVALTSVDPKPTSTKVGIGGFQLDKQTLVIGGALLALLLFARV